MDASSFFYGCCWCCRLFNVHKPIHLFQLLRLNRQKLFHFVWFMLFCMSASLHIVVVPMTYTFYITNRLQCTILSSSNYYLAYIIVPLFLPRLLCFFSFLAPLRMGRAIRATSFSWILHCVRVNSNQFKFHDWVMFEFLHFQCMKFLKLRYVCSCVSLYWFKWRNCDWLHCTHFLSHLDTHMPMASSSSSHTLIAIVTISVPATVYTRGAQLHELC